MKTIPITNFRNQLKQMLDYVQQGNNLSVTSHGKEIVQISPPKTRKKKFKYELKKIASSAVIRDVTSPINTKWDATQ